MSQSELLKDVIRTLNSVKIEYMLTGSIVSSLQGEPRSTHDIDIVIAINRKSIKQLLNSFNSRYYLDEEDILNAAAHNTMFNMIDENSGDKVDFWILTEDPFDQSRFSRRYAEDIFDIQVIVSCPEDTILAKLRWAKLSGGSEKQFTDALRIYEVQFEKLNIEYLKKWARVLDVESLFLKLQKEAGIIKI
jgi:hypothetical protein